MVLLPLPRSENKKDFAKKYFSALQKNSTEIQSGGCAMAWRERRIRQTKQARSKAKTTVPADPSHARSTLMPALD